MMFRSSVKYLVSSGKSWIHSRDHNRMAIDQDHGFDRDHDRNENFSPKVWLKIPNQRLLIFFQSGFDCKKLNGYASAIHDGKGSHYTIFQSKSA
jgi:hypothetical protein